MLKKPFYKNNENSIGYHGVTHKGLLNLFILPYVPGFLKLYPDIRLTLKITDALPALEFGEAHIIIRPAIHGAETGDLIQKPLFRNNTGLYASEQYLKEFGIPKEPRDLNNHRLIAYGNHVEAEPFKAMNWHLILGTTPGEVREAFLQVNSPQARVFLAKAGLGIIALSKEHPGLKESGLIQIFPHISGPTIESYYIYPKELENSRKVIALRDYLKEAFVRDYGVQESMESLAQNF